MLLFFQRICMVCGHESPPRPLCWVQGPYSRERYMNTWFHHQRLRSDAAKSKKSGNLPKDMQQCLLVSKTRISVFQVCAYCIKCKTFWFALLPEIYQTSEIAWNESKSWSPFSVGRVPGKIQVISCTLQLSYILCFQACYVAWHLALICRTPIDK